MGDTLWDGIKDAGNSINTTLNDALADPKKMAELGQDVQTAGLTASGVAAALEVGTAALVPVVAAVGTPYLNARYGQYFEPGSKLPTVGDGLKSGAESLGEISKVILPVVAIGAGVAALGAEIKFDAEHPDIALDALKGTAGGPGL